MGEGLQPHLAPPILDRFLVLSFAPRPGFHHSSVTWTHNLYLFWFSHGVVMEVNYNQMASQAKSSQLIFS